MIVLQKAKDSLHSLFGLFHRHKMARIIKAPDIHQQRFRFQPLGRGINKHVRLGAVEQQNGLVKPSGMTPNIMGADRKAAGLPDRIAAKRHGSLSGLFGAVFYIRFKESIFPVSKWMLVSVG